MEMITDKEIISDINKMKDIRKNINIYSEFIISKYQNEIDRLDKIINNDDFIYLGLLFIILLVNNGIIALILYSIEKKYINILIKEKEDIKKNIEIELNNKNSYIGVIDQYIDNQETILEYRKGKELTESKIKNINLYFILDERYNYVLREINTEYNMIPLNVSINKNDIIEIDKFCDKMNGLYPGKEEIKTKGKVLIYNNSLNDKF